MTHTLLADIGGTNARFALYDDGASGSGVLRTLGTTRTADHPDFVEAAKSVLGERQPDRIAVCVAGPVRDGAADLTNAGWSLCEASIGQAFDGASCLMINDFAAQAHALARLDDDDWRAIGKEITSNPDAPLIAVGPGTGLGVAVLTDASDAGRVISGEGGHVSLAARTDREWRVIQHLSQTYGHVSAERVISGSGLALLYNAVRRIDDVAGTAVSDGEAVTGLMQAGDQHACEAVNMFSAFLGTVASDLAVTNGAFGGVYLCGGILPTWGEAFPASVFRQRFEDKGRFADYLGAIPTRLVTTPQAAFIGLLRALEVSA